VRILFVSIEYPPETPDGIGSYVAEIGPALVARGHEVHVLSCLPGQAASDRVDRGVHVHRRGEARLPGGSKTAQRLRHALSCRVETARLGLDFDVVVRWLESGEERSFELGGWCASGEFSPDGRWAAVEVSEPVMDAELSEWRTSVRVYSLAGEASPPAWRVEPPASAPRSSRTCRNPRSRAWFNEAPSRTAGSITPITPGVLTATVPGYWC